MTHASARIRQSSCHSRLRSAAGLPRPPTTHTMASLSSGSPHVTSQAGREAQVTSPVLARATTRPVPTYLPKAAKPTTGPKVPVSLPAAGHAGPGPDPPRHNCGRRPAQGSRIPDPATHSAGQRARAWLRHSASLSAVRACRAGTWPSHIGGGGGCRSRVAAGAAVAAVSRAPMVGGHHAVLEVHSMNSAVAMPSKNTARLFRVPGPPGAGGGGAEFPRIRAA